jgi:hypothetical protein
MALFDTTAQVITVFKADTADMKAGLKELKGHEKDLLKAQIDAAEARNKTYSDWIKDLGNVNQALELVGKAVQFGKEAFKAYSEGLRMSAAAGFTNIEALKKASLGMRTEHELMTFAAQTQHGVIKASQADMELAQKAMVGLTRAGFDQEDVTKKITEAMIKLNVGALDDFGIKIKEGKTPLETYSNLMKALSDEAKGVDPAFRSNAEGVEAFGVTIQDSLTRMKQSLGELVVAMEPLLTKLAQAVEKVTYLVDKIPGMSGGPLDFLPEELRGTLFSGALDLLPQGEKTRAIPFSSWTNQYGDASKVPQAPGPATFDAGTFATFMAGVIGELEKKGKAGGSGGLNPGGYDKLNIGRDTAGPMLGFSTAIGSAADYRQYDSFGFEDTGGAFIKAEGERLSAEELERTKKLTEDWAANLEKYRQQEKSLLESMIGPVSEFDVYAEGFKMLGETMQVAGGAWSNALKEIGTSTDSLGKIAKKAFGTIVQGIGEKLAAQSASHLVEALANTVLLNPVEAGKHYAAAGIYGAGAIAAFATAKAMGAGGGAQPAKPSGGAAAGGAGGGSGYAGDPNGRYVKQEQPKIFVIGQSFGRSSVRERAREARETVSYAMGYVGGEDS